MTEIPEHLRKRAEEARKKAAASTGASDDAPAAADAPPTEAESKIPAHLLGRSKAAKATAAGGDVSTEVASSGGGGVATATAPPTVAPPVATGPGGHTQRLLTVVKSGSIQDVKATPQDKVHVWPHLLIVEFVAALACTAFLLVFSIFVNAPLLELANFNQTPNPSKAPWYFLGLQELLKWFHPMVAGVLLPGMALVGLILAPYSDRNPSNKPEHRKFAISLFTVFLMYWSVLVLMGTFFRGPGFNFIFPWNVDLFVEL
jgi:menaquinol-cytochrome c reductase cytochrome b/c subunit